MNMNNTPQFSPLGTDLFGEQVRPRSNGPLADKFTFPPFSILDARQGDWQERKRAWLATGIQSEVGRGPQNGLTMSQTIETLKPGTDQARTRGLARSNGQDLMKGENKNFPRQPDPGLTWVGGSRSFDDLDEVSRKILAASSSGTSIFDPVLCELAYRWFCPPSGQIIDPFAGGSVRGIVASLMGLDYWGCDLRQEQIDANEVQAETICPDNPPIWVCGDSIDRLTDAPEADFIFSCPPYGDLERYSDDPADLSTMEYHTFLAAYKRIIFRCSQKLKPESMACFVVGDFRDKRTGNYRGFVADTINAFREVGMALYNDAVLVTAVGSLPIRVSAQFEKSRKLGKTHQNVLVFRK